MKKNTETTNTTTTAKRAINSTIDEAKGVLTIETDAGTLTIDIEALSPEMAVYATLHGLKQKIVDAAAGLGTIGEKYEAMAGIRDRILDGEWNKRAEGSGTPSGLLLKALIRLYPDKDANDLKDFLATKDKKEQAALRKNPKVAAIIETIKAESMKTSGIDSDELLDELDTI